MAFSDKLKFFFRRKKLIGKDKYGNSYYETSNNKTKKRWVVYSGIAEPTKIPANWHLWLHYTDDNVPKEDSSAKHVPNLTGTKYAYNSNCYLTNQQNNITYKSWSPNG